MISCFVARLFFFYLAFIWKKKSENGFEGLSHCQNVEQRTLTVTFMAGMRGRGLPPECGGY